MSALSPLQCNQRRRPSNNRKTLSPEFPKLRLTQTISTDANDLNNNEISNHFKTPLSPINIVAIKAQPSKSKSTTKPIESSSNKLVNEIRKLDQWDKEHIDTENMHDLYTTLNKGRRRNSSTSKILTLANRATVSSKLSSRIDMTKLKSISDQKEQNPNKAFQSIAKKCKGGQSFNYEPFLKERKDKGQLRLTEANSEVTSNEKPEIVRNMLREKVKSENYVRGEIMEILHYIIINKIEKKKYEEILDELYCCLEDLRLECSLQVDMLSEKTRTIARQYEQISQGFNALPRQKRKSIFANPSAKAEDKGVVNLLEEKMKVICYAKGQVAKFDECKSSYMLSYNKLKREYDAQIKECKETIKRLTDEEKYLKLIYQQINKEQCDYYLEILKTGVDCRSEGLLWVIRRLNELNALLDYNMFPSFLDHDQIDYLMQMSKLTNENTQHKLMLKTMRVRQQKMKEEHNDQAMMQFNKNNSQDYIRSLISKTFNPRIFSKATLKRFEDIYRRHEAIVKQTLDTAFEDFHINDIIQEIKSQLAEDSAENANHNKSSSILQLLMQDEKQKEYFQELLALRAKIKSLDTIIEAKNKEQQMKFKQRFANTMNDSKSQELSFRVYSALFGTQLSM